ncbi:MAG: hypothetical protein OXU51_16535 [Candidatus Poribacteria bacterium]|nr:hypothetical protein [Candidatus Poribacteria bacterium]
MILRIEYFIQSLRHRPERAYTAIGSLSGQCFPMKNVHIVWGKYWADFDDLFAAISADGFSDELSSLADAKPGYAAGTWSFFRTFRAIEANQIRYAMLFEDDFIFKIHKSDTPISHSYVQEVCKALPKDFKIGILGYCLAEPDTHRTFRALRPVNEYWGAGVVNTSSSHNVANIYSLPGIRLMRETAARSKFSTTENVIGRLHNEPGVYSLLTPIIDRSPMRGHSDGMPHTNTSEDPNVVRWQEGFNVDVP